MFNGNLAQVDTDLTIKTLRVTSRDIVITVSVYRYGKLVTVRSIANFTGVAANTYHELATGLPITATEAEISIPNEYGNPGVATFRVTGNKLEAKCTASNSYYYCTMAYLTND